MNSGTARLCLAHATDNDGDATLGMQAARKLIHIGGRRRDEQATRGLRIVERIQHARLQVIVGSHT